MNFNEYQELTRRTAPDLSPKERIDDYVYGLNGEIGELTDAIKKWRFHGHDLQTDELIYEFGDIFWYFSRLAEEFGFPLEFIATVNIEKLKKRYPGGFSHEASRNRTE